MINCAICNRNYDKSEVYVAFKNSDNSDVLMCAECEKRINILYNSDNEEQYNNSVSYILDCLKINTDPQVREFLKDSLNKKFTVSDNPEITENGWGWIGFIRVLSWINFVFFIIIAIFVSITLKNLFYGIVVFMLSLVGLSLINIFLGIASDIKTTRYILERKYRQ
jgi:hypothetical protein